MKICLTCGREYQPTGGAQKRCVECGAQEDRAHRAAYHVVYGPGYNALHHEEKATYNKNYLAANLDKLCKKAREWGRKNPEKLATVWRKHTAKRRALGFNPLNSPFAGSTGHHINQSDVVYIPMAMHKSVSHNVWTGRNMEKINLLAGEYLTEDWT
jgi:hypothetical protein